MFSSLVSEEGMVLKFAQGWERRRARGGGDNPSKDSSQTTKEEESGSSPHPHAHGERERVRFRTAPRGFKQPPRKPYRGDDSIDGVRIVRSDEELRSLVDESRAKGTKLFVEFGTAWCEHCKGMVPAMAALGRAHRKHTFAVADVFHTPVVSERVVYTPTFWVYDRGVKVDQLIGSDVQNLKDRAWLHLS